MAYKLTYFDTKGRGEGIRMIFAAAGVKYIDNRIKGESWPALKPTTPWGQIPLLEVGDKKLAQTVTICRYLGREFKLAGENEWESSKCDEYVDSINDLFAGWMKYFFEKDEEKKKKLHEEFKANDIPRYLSKFDDIKAKVGGPYLVGQKLTWADIFIADKLDRLQESEGSDVLNKYKNMKTFKDAVFAHPNIAAYVAQRPKD